MLKSGTKRLFIFVFASMALGLAPVALKKRVSQFKEVSVYCPADVHAVISFATDFMSIV
jgi:hypothetical protein